MAAHVSVAVIGGGPAGAVAALLLARDGIDVVLFERSPEHRFEHGEVLAAEARSILVAIGLWPRRPRVGMARCESIRHAWHSSLPRERMSITNPHGPDWYIARCVFDDWLLKEAASAGARVCREARVRTVVRVEDRWRVAVTGPVRGQVLANIVVDASGRSRSVRHWSGAVRTRHDALCAVFTLATRLDQNPGLLIEATPDGWCYSLAVSDDSAIAAFVTEPEVLAKIGRGDAAIRSALGSAPLTRARLGKHRETAATVPAHTTSLDTAGGDGWLAVGDAALAHDPLSGQGVLFALRSAIDAARAVQERLASDTSSVGRYADAIRHRTEAYLSQRQSIYAAQPRWRERPFWQRRAHETDGIGEIIREHP